MIDESRIIEQTVSDAIIQYMLKNGSGFSEKYARSASLFAWKCALLAVWTVKRMEGTHVGSIEDFNDLMSAIGASDYAYDPIKMVGQFLKFQKKFPDLQAAMDNAGESGNNQMEMFIAQFINGRRARADQFGSSPAGNSSLLSPDRPKPSGPNGKPVPEDIEGSIQRKT